MADDDDTSLICIHVNVPDMNEFGSGVLFDFVCVRATLDGKPLPGQTNVEIWIPQAVLLGIATTLPEVLGEMGKRAERAAEGGAKH